MSSPHKRLKNFISPVTFRYSFIYSFHFSPNTVKKFMKINFQYEFNFACYFVFSVSLSGGVTRGAFHLAKISGISGSAVNGTRFVGSIYVSRSLYQFQVHGRAPSRTGVYDQMEQLFTTRKFHFCYHRNFRVFFLNGKRPSFSVGISEK